MKKGKIDIVFLIIISLAILLLSYLVKNVIEKIVDLQGIIKLSGSLLVPLPIALFFNYMSSPKGGKNLKPGKKDVIASVIILAVVLVVTIGFITLYEMIGLKSFEENMVLPVLLNSTVIIAYAINYITSNNVKIAGFLSGVLLGMAISIFIL